MNLRSYGRPFSRWWVVVALIGIAAIFGLQHIVRTAAAHDTDRFWSLTWIDGVEAEHFDSLDDMYDDVDAVVVGSLESIAPGRVIGDVATDNAAYYVTVALRIDQVLRARDGLDLDERTVNLEFVTFQQEVVPMLTDAFAPDSGLFFLTNKGLNAERSGEPESVQELESGYYRLAVSYGTLRNTNGRALLRPGTEESFMAGHVGRQFNDVVNELRRGP